MRLYTLIPAGLMLLGGAALADDVQVRSDQDPATTTQVNPPSSADVRQSVREGREAIQGRQSPLAMGELRDGREVKSTITTSATGLFLGQGLNAAYERSFSPKLSGVAGANFSRTRAGAGAVTNFGVLAGMDWFIIGEHNEGLRLGPRVAADFGSETVVENRNFTSLGLAGEVGYNWISSAGITAGVAGGLRGQTAPLARQEYAMTAKGGWYPYGSVNLGYSW